jgi:four helix bundle protein
MFRFQKLEVWQKAVDLAVQIYALTRDFPADERFGLTSQVRRAAVSISSNIAEGSSRASDVDFSRFLEIAYGSLMEVVSQVLVAQRLDMVSEAAAKEICAKAEESARMLSGLRAKLQQGR